VLTARTTNRITKPVITLNRLFKASIGSPEKLSHPSEIAIVAENVGQSFKPMPGNLGKQYYYL
jgi:hypothetical protein